MAGELRYYVRSSDGQAIDGFDELDVARTVARQYGDGTHVVDTLAQAYVPMLHEVRDGDLVYAGFGGWDTGRFGPDHDLIEAVKKGHVALVHAFIAKGADANARDADFGPALHWAVGGGKPEIVQMLIDNGADIAARDGNGVTALGVAETRGDAAVAEMLRVAGAAE